MSEREMTWDSPRCTGQGRTRVQRWWQRQCWRWWQLVQMCRLKMCMELRRYVMQLGTPLPKQRQRQCRRWWAITEIGSEPLHIAARNPSAEAAIQALLAAGSDPQAKDNESRTPLYWALHQQHSPARVQAAALLATAGPTQAVLEELCSADTEIAWELLPPSIASRLPLTKAQWELIPAYPIPGLGRILPAALASSVAQAGQVVQRLSLPDAQRLRTFVLCLARRQRSCGQSRELGPQYLPAAAVQRILSFFDA